MLGVEFVFGFTRGAIFCRDGSVKRLDVQNRFKAICDLLAAAMHTDDKFFFQISGKKCVRVKESVVAIIKVIEPGPDLS